MSDTRYQSYVKFYGDASDGVLPPNYLYTFKVHSRGAAGALLDKFSGRVRSAWFVTKDIYFGTIKENTRIR